MKIWRRLLPVSCFLALANLVACPQGRSEEAVLRLASGHEIQRAEFRHAQYSKNRPAGVLVLCPGQNGTGAEFLADAAWREFAEASNLAIIVPGFVSDNGDLKAGRGYFEASRGSGALLLEALKKCGWEGVPLLLYGFSGGAHFTTSFAAWAPKRVLGFCAYSFGWWSPPPEHLRCPALIACGQHDATRYGSSFSYFQEGRRQGKPWAWASIGAQEHDHCPKLDEFVREYFQSLLVLRSSDQVTVDNVRKSLLKEATCNPLTTSVLPGELVLPAWQSLHHP